MQLIHIQHISSHTALLNVYDEESIGGLNGEWRKKWIRIDKENWKED